MSESVSEVPQRLRAARSGSLEDLGEALEAYRAYLLLIAERELDPAVRAKGGASDLVQQTFLEAQRDFDRFEGDSDADLKAWLRRLLLNHVANFTRDFRATQKRNLSREVAHRTGDSSTGIHAALASDTATPSGHAMANEELAALERAIARLPDDYRQVIQYRCDEQRSFDEVGKLMQRSANAARKLWARAIERLGEEFERSEGSEA